VWLIKDRARLAKQVEQTQASLRQKELELQQQREANRQAINPPTEVTGGTQPENESGEQSPDRQISRNYLR